MPRAETKRKYDRVYRTKRFFCTATFTLEEKKALMERVGESGLSPSQYLKSSALSSKIKAKQTPITKETIGQLGRIGNNLNQIARSLNNQYNTPDFQHMQGEIAIIKTQLQTILKAVNP